MRAEDARRYTLSAGVVALALPLPNAVLFTYAREAPCTGLRSGFREVIDRLRTRFSLLGSRRDYLHQVRRLTC
jgi:hypothetical protein